MTGPMTAAAACACLLGLAACGGGGGGAGGGGDPVPMKPSFNFDMDAAEVGTVNDAIDAHTPTPPPGMFSWFGRSRYTEAFGWISYRVTTTGDGAPSIHATDPATSMDFEDMDSEELGHNVWKFTEDYTATDTTKNYRALVVMSYDSALTGSDNRHFWGVWLRQNLTTDEWDEVETFNNRSASGEVDIHNQGADYQDVHNALTGMASFKGTALGVYTKNDTSSAGWFSADASLTVNFGGDTVETADRFTMTGTIDNFALSGQEEHRWKVTLSGAPGKDSNTGVPTNTDWNGTTSTGGTEDGAFRVVLSGTASETPSRMRGVFDAHFSDGKAVGAFNATTTTDTP